MKILILGSGGREAALAWKLAASPRVERVYVAPGNAGTASVAQNVSLDPLNFAQVKEFILENGIDMLVPGAEEPIVRGIRDYFVADAHFRNLAIVAPGKEGARLEGSKVFAKAFMKRAGVPTADYAVFELRAPELRRNSHGKVVEGGFRDGGSCGGGGAVGTEGGLAEAKRFLSTLAPPYVLKADGLAAGKGTVIEADYGKACAVLEEMQGGKFGEASQKVVIERFLDGEEMSVFVLSDGKDYKIFPEARDYKRAGEGDTGPNTGGMGAVSPVAWADAALMQKVESRIVRPTFAQLQKEHIPYAGFLYIGLTVVNGAPFVLEYNVRLGDPEAEVILPRVESDLAELFEAVHQGTLSEKDLQVSPRAAGGVVLASGGYPGRYATGCEVTLPGAAAVADVETPSAAAASELPVDGNRPAGAPDVFCFHAGTVRTPDGKIQTGGGRVLTVTALGDSLGEALRKAYGYADQVEFQDKFYRKDIGKDLCR